jgi:hypothetical protein
MTALKATVSLSQIRTLQKEKYPSYVFALYSHSLYLAVPRAWSTRSICFVELPIAVDRPVCKPATVSWKHSTRIAACASEDVHTSPVPCVCSPDAALVGARPFLDLGWQYHFHEKVGSSEPG